MEAEGILSPVRKVFRWGLISLNYQPSKNLSSDNQGLVNLLIVAHTDYHSRGGLQIV